MEYPHYTYDEREDAKKVDQALDQIQRRNLGEARMLLEQVIVRTPQYYVYSFETDKELFIKFWDLAEYLGYIAMTRRVGEPVVQEVIWLHSAYPRAHFFMSKIECAEGQTARAAEHLDIALRLEPDHPVCLCEMADLLAKTGDNEGAAEYYEAALSARPYMGGKTLTRAQKGMAELLVAEGRIAEAEELLAESIKTDAGAALAENIMRYAKALQAGDVTLPVALRVDPSTLEQDDEPREPSPEPVVHQDPAAPRPVKRAWWKFWKGPNPSQTDSR